MLVYSSNKKYSHNLKVNDNLQKIIIHHTESDLKISGKELNKIFIKNGENGLPYDIIINYDGTIDLTHRWIYNQDPVNYKEDVATDIIFKYKRHLLSNIGPEEYKDNAINVAVVGNFDLYTPTPLQYSALVDVIKQFVCEMGIPAETAIIYYNEISVGTSPGVYFFNKAQIISSCLDTTYVPPTQPYHWTFDTGDLGDTILRSDCISLWRQIQQIITSSGEQDICLYSDNTIIINGESIRPRVCYIDGEWYFWCGNTFLGDDSSGGTTGGGTTGDDTGGGTTGDDTSGGTVDGDSGDGDGGGGSGESDGGTVVLPPPPGDGDNTQPPPGADTGTGGHRDNDTDGDSDSDGGGGGDSDDDSDGDSDGDGGGGIIIIIGGDDDGESRGYGDDPYGGDDIYGYGDIF